MFYIFCLVNTCVMFAVAVFTALPEPSSTVDSAVLWQMPTVSFLCTLGCLIYPWDKECGKWKMALIRCIHYLYINGVVLGTGFWFGWYRPDRWGSVISMVILIALIFVLVSAVSIRKAAAEARRMNQRLKEYQRNLEE